MKRPTQARGRGGCALTKDILMPRKAATPPIICEFHTWRLFRRNGLYYADGRANRPSLGKHSLNTSDHQEALNQLRALDHHLAVQHGKAAPKPTTSAVPMDDGWTRFIQFCARPEMLGGVTKATLKRYQAVRDKHLDHCREKGVTTWNHVDKKAIERYGAWLKSKEYADATIYLELNLLSQILKWLVTTEKLLPESSLVVLKLRRSEESDTYCYARQEVRAMVDHCRAHSGLHWLAEIILGLATTGVRIGELVDLRWGDVDFAHNTITLPDNRYSGRARLLGMARTTKGRKTRRVPIHASLKSVLENMRRRHDGFVFSGPRGGRAKADTIRNLLIRDVISKLKERFATTPGDVGFEHGRLHSFRHYFVSQAFISGVSEGEIRSWVGHRDSRIIERYRHLGNDDAQRKMNQIDFLDNEATTPGVPASAASAPNCGGAHDERDNANDAA